MTQRRIVKMIDEHAALLHHLFEIAQTQRVSDGRVGPGNFTPEPLTDSGRKPLGLSGSCDPMKAGASVVFLSSSCCQLTRLDVDDLAE
jgi:hypothetical protein